MQTDCLKKCEYFQRMKLWTDVTCLFWLFKWKNEWLQTDCREHDGKTVHASSIEKTELYGGQLSISN